jgi:hypothetical protein
MCLAAAVVPAGASSTTAGVAPSFAPAKSYATGRTPVAVAIGDLDADRKPDLAAVNANPGGKGSVSVLLNTGDGSFRTKVDYRTGRGPRSLAIGDLNTDGKPDLATANGIDTVSVLLNTGDGTFQAKRDYKTGSSPHAVAIGDLNTDGKPDLATANGFYTVSVLLNGGDGSFEAERDYRTGRTAQSVAIGDLNTDGKPDLAIATYPNAVAVLMNRGDGSFQAKHDYRTGGSPSSVAIGDLNTDGKPDLATANDRKTVSVFLNRGDGKFQPRRDYGKPDATPESVAIGDLNSDGKPDLATANTYFGQQSPISTVAVFSNRGNGRFQVNLNYATGSGPYSVAIGDLNGDAKPDVATASSGANTVSVLLNTPGLCTVQNVLRTTLSAARRTIARANCRVGKIRRAYSRAGTKDHVISQKPRFGAVLPANSRVSLVVGLGRRG